MSLYDDVRAILVAPEWEPVNVIDYGAFVTIAGRFNGVAHAGSRADWEGLARDLDRIARERHAAAEKAAKILEVVEAPVIEPDPRDAELAALRARVAELEAAPSYIDLSERPVEESPIPPPPSPAVVALEKMEALKARVDGARASVPTELQTLMEDGESVKDAKQRLWPLLMSELEDLQNQEALFGKSIPRREEVESLLGVLGRLGEY